MINVQKSRLCHIDLIESIAILFVVTYHSTLYSTDFLSNPSISVYLSYFFTTILSTCVPLFFFANGYLLFNRSFTLKKHIYRMIRIILTIFIWSPICVSTLMVIGGIPLNIENIMNHTLYLNTEYGANIFWFLGALFCIYLLFPALKALYDSNKQTFIFLTILFAIFSFGIVMMNQILTFAKIATHYNFKKIDHPALLMLNPFRNSYGYSFVYFCVGGLAFHYEDSIRSISQTKRNLISILGILISCTLLFLVGIFFSRYVDHEIWDVVWNGYDTVFTFCNVIFIYIISLNYTKDYLFIRTLSINTLGIYVTHLLVIWLTYMTVAAFTFMRNPLMNIIFAFLVICICLMLCSIIKKIPLLKKLI